MRTSDCGVRIGEAVIDWVAPYGLRDGIFLWRAK